MARQAQRLGKGLNALLGDYIGEATPSTAGLEQRLPLDQMRPNPFQPRETIDPEALTELADSIQQNGLLQPIVVRPSDQGGWEVVAGERRLQAMRRLEWEEVPAVVREVDDRTMLVLALIENLQREDLSPLDEARAYQRLVEEFELTQAQVAERVGRDRSTVTNTIRLLGLPEPVRELLAASKISAGHARALLGLEDEGRVVELAKAVAEQGWSVREVERRVRQRRGPRRSMPRGAGGPETRTSPYATRAEQTLSRALGTSVRVRLESSSRGRIEIPFQDAEDFERIVEVIVGAGGFE